MSPTLIQSHLKDWKANPRVDHSRDVAYPKSLCWLSISIAWTPHCDCVDLSLYLHGLNAEYNAVRDLHSAQRNRAAFWIKYPLLLIKNIAVSLVEFSKRVKHNTNDNQQSSLTFQFATKFTPCFLI